MPRPKLRPYQEQYYEKTMAVLQRRNRVLLVMPTGTGKTTIFSYLSFDKIQENKKVMIIVHRIELLDQAAGRLQDYDLICATIGGDGVVNYNATIQVAMVQSIKKEIPFKPDYIIVDEAHHSLASSYLKLFQLFPQAKVIGFTATPIRLDGKGFDDIYEELIDIYPVSYFIDQGYLVSPKHYLCVDVDLEEVEIRDGDYSPAQVAKALKTARQMPKILESYKKFTPGKQVVIFANDLEQSKQLAELFNNNNIKAAHIDGSIRKTERNEIVERYKKGEILVLTNFDIVSEGFDVPNCEGVILGRPTKSLSLYIQMVGRCLRPNKERGKEFGFVLDCASCWVDHGFAGINYEWTLQGAIETNTNAKLKSLLFKKRRKGTETLASFEELEGLELISLSKELERIVEFDRYIQEAKENELSGYYVLDKYKNFLKLQGLQMLETEINICKEHLANANMIIDENSWEYAKSELCDY